MLRKFIVAALLVSGVLAVPATGQWSADPQENLAIADRSGEQVVPKIATRPDNGTYVGWYDNASGNYDIYLQRLDAEGVELWGHNGIKVSDHAQDTSVTDWDLICDSAGNAVLVFSDIRTGNLDVQAYKIGPDGSQMWGADGITLSVLPDFEPAPQLCEASDGDIVVVWGRSPSTGFGKICMQRLSAAGALRFPAPLDIAGDVNESPGFALVVPADSGSVIVSWLRNIRQFTSPRHIRARKFGPDGAPLWANHVVVFDQTVVPIGYWPQLLPDGAGGAVFGWHRSLSNLYNSCVQRLTATGLEVFPHNGVVVSTNAALFHIDPDFAFNPATGEIFAAWNERTTLQSQWGIYAQKITPAGTRAWTENGRELQPVNTLYKALPRCAPLGDGVVVLWMDEPGGFDQDRLRATRLDGDGAAVWPNGIVDVATSPSSKSRHPVTIDGVGTLKTVWEDDRNGTPDLYGQNVNADGSLGPTPVRVALRSLEAVAIEAGVRLTWLFQATEPTTCRLLRRTAGETEWEPVGSELAAEVGVRELTWIDRDVLPQTGYAYVVQFAQDGGWMNSAPIEVTTTAVALALGTPAPNPASGAVAVSYAVPRAQRVVIGVYDARGRLVKRLLDDIVSTGRGEVRWLGDDAAGRRVAGGTYFLRLETAGGVTSRTIARVQ